MLKTRIGFASAFIHFVFAAENLRRMHDEEGQGLLFDCPPLELCKVAIVVRFYPRLHLHFDDALLLSLFLLNLFFVSTEVCVCDCLRSCIWR